MIQPPNNGHSWVTGEQVGFEPPSYLSNKLVCRECGILRRADGGNGPCKGRVKVTPREAT